MYFQIYIIKQDIRISNDWTDRADILCEHSWLAGGCHRIKKLDLFLRIFFSNFFSRATAGNIKL